MRLMRVAAAAMISMAALAAGAGTASAAIIASSNFSSGDQGWLNGNGVSLAQATEAVTYNGGAQNISVVDDYDVDVFVAPAAYLGNQSAAIGGTLSFRVGDTQNDALPYSAVYVIGTNGHAYASQPSAFPSTTGLTSYSISLVASNFYDSALYNPSNNNIVRPSVSDSEFAGVLGSLARLGILADWHTGGDQSTLDDVVLTSGSTPAAPEPATWALMTIGVGLAGLAMRRRGATAAA